MKFSFETPINYLNKIDKEQDYLFILAHHLSNKKYYDYCKNSTKYKILDNGCYELGESIPSKKLLELANEIRVDVIIIPDKLFDKKRSLQLEKEFFKLYNKSFYNFKLMKVVCGNNLNEYLNSLLEVAEDKNVDIIGLSKSRTIIAPNLTYLMNYIEDNCKTSQAAFKEIHLLGLSHPYELIEASNYNKIKTCDTGLPINFAFKNKLFPKIKKSNEFIRVSGEELDIEKKLDVNLVKKNIKILRGYYGIN